MSEPGRVPLYTKRGWYYADLRQRGGGQVALRTRDETEALIALGARLEEMKSGPRETSPQTAEAIPRLLDFMDQHFEQKRLDGDARQATCDRDRAKLEQIATWLDNPRLDRITKKTVKGLKVRLQRKGHAPTTIARYLSALSSLMQSALDEFEDIDGNPVRAVKWPNVKKRQEQPWLEPEQGYNMIAAAQQLSEDRGCVTPRYRGPAWIGPLVAAALLTGARQGELFCLQVEDVNLDAAYTRIRPNHWHAAWRGEERLKSDHAPRTVPLWPQLRPILQGHIGDRRHGPLWPMPNGQPPRDLRGAMDRVFGLAGVSKPKGKLWHLFRHTYAAMRLQTLDHGEPVSVYTVAKELGHSSTTLIESTYGHLIQHRENIRLDRVEYRPLKLAQRGVA